MDWPQIADPQILLGVGILAFGAVNAYIRRRLNQGATEAVLEEETQLAVDSTVLSSSITHEGTTDESESQFAPDGISTEGEF